MNRLVRTAFIVGMSIVLLIIGSTVVFAQSGWDIRFSRVSTPETPSSMILKIYFNFFDPTTGAPVVNANLTSAQVTITDTNQVAQGVVKKPDVPIHITLVLDSSGSMAAAVAMLQQAAKQALNDAPDNSFFSVVQFDETIKLIQGFTQNISAVSSAIDQYQVNPKSTCLYDAAYTAVEILGRAPVGCRAVILFTDGRDEESDGKPYSQHTFQDLVTFAKQMQVLINPIGLSDVSSDINSTELQSMATNTGGFYAIGGQSDLSNSFRKITDALKAQSMVQVSAYPIRGTNQATLAVPLQDNSSLTPSFSFNSNTNHPDPPSPVVAEVDGLLFHPENSTYDIQLSLTSPNLVSYIKVSVWDIKSGSLVATYVFYNPVSANTFNFPTDQLTVGNDYELHIIAVSKSDNKPFLLARDTQGNATTELIHAFTFNPSAFSPQIQIQSVAQQANDIALTITTTNTGLIGGFKGWIIDENTNTKVQNSDFTLPALGTSSGTIVIPAGANKIPDGKYTLVVQVLGKNNQVYSSANYSGVVYTAVRPSIFQTIWVALIGAPILLGLIIAILLGVVGYFMYLSMRLKSMTGTPVMQGRLGEKLTGGRWGGPVLPLADNEPIPTRGMLAAQPVAVSAHLTVERSPQDISSQGKQIALEQFPFIIGRLEGNLLLQDPNISRLHAQITFDGANRTYLITDLNSSNGTRLNGVPLVPGQAKVLTSGASIHLGPNVVVRFDLI